MIGRPTPVRLKLAGSAGVSAEGEASAEPDRAALATARIRARRFMAAGWPGPVRIPLRSAVGPAGAGRGDGLAQIARGQSPALGHAADAGQAQVAALGLAAQCVLGARRNGQQDLVIVA